MSSKLLVLLLLAGVVLPSAPAQQKAVEKPAPAAPDFSKEAYVIERLYTRINEESDGTGTREMTAEVKMLADAGVKAFAVLKFTYTSSNEVVELDYVRVRRPDGTVVKTPDYNIQDMPAEVTRSAPLYSDIHEKHVAVKGLSVGDALEYLVRYRVVKPEVPGHFWYEDSFAKDAVVRDERLEISVPGDKYVKVVSPEFKPEIKDEGPRRVYRWTHANLEVKEKDPAEVPRRIPPNPDVRVTTFASWENVGHWYGDLQKDPLQVTPAIQAKATELTKGLQTDEEKIHAIYNFVSLKFHYIGLDFGIGRYQPHAADDVLDNGYGDCKDKHTLLASLLKAVGIEAWPALIHINRKLDPEVPSPAQFDHVITVVPSGGRYTWLDTTPEVAPYGLLLLQLRNKQALVIPTNQAAMLLTTPPNPPAPQRQEFSMEGKLGTDGTFTGHAEQIYEGDVAVALREAFRQVSESQWKEAAQRFSYGLNFAGDVSAVKVSAPDELDKPFEISYDYVRKNFGDWENRHTLAPLPPMGLEVLKDAKERKPSEPVLLGALGKISFRARVELPAGYKAVPPTPCHLVESYAEYDDNTAIENGVMTTTRTLLVKKNEVPLSEWEGYRKFGRAMADDEFGFIQLSHVVGAGKNSGETVVMGKTEAHNEEDSANKEAGRDKGNDDKVKENGKAGADESKESDNADLDSLFSDGNEAMQQRDYQKAQEMYEKVIAKDPDYPGVHFNLGLALTARRNFTAALEQLHKAEEASPDDPRAYQMAAAYLAEVGRRDEAAQEWRKLLKENPENRTAAATLGGLLYQAGKYPDAVQVLETAVKAAPDSPGLQMQLGQAYLKTGQREKAVASMRQAVEQKGDDPETLNEVAYTLAENQMNLDLARKYAEKAVDKLDEQAQGAKSSDEAGLRVTYLLSAVWDTLGWVYFQQGNLKRAESLIRPAWLLGENTIVAEHLGEIYEKEGKTQQAAHAYEFALAVSSAGVFGIGTALSDSQRSYRSQADEIIARYEKLTGKKPTPEIRRLPDGTWTQTPAEQLRHTREVKVSNEAKLSGRAQFIIVIKPGKAESAHYLSGEEDLQPLSDKLAAAHYPLEFPPASAAILVLRLDVNCQSTAPCIATLVNPLPAAPQFPGAAY